MELREPSTESPILRLFENPIPISLSTSSTSSAVVSVPCVGTDLLARTTAAHQEIRTVLLDAQTKLEAELYELARGPVYGATYNSQKTQRDGGELMAKPFEQVEQEIFEICRTDRSYRRTTLIETVEGKIGIRHKYINPRDGTGSYRKALEREAACRSTMERVKLLRSLRKKVLSRLNAIAKREAEDQALLADVLDAW